MHKTKNIIQTALKVLPKIKESFSEAGTMYTCARARDKTEWGSEWERESKEDKAALRCSKSISCSVSMDACGMKLCWKIWMEPAELGKCGGVLEKAPSAWLTYIASLLLTSRRYTSLTNWWAFLCQAPHPHWFVPFNMRSGWVQV